MIRKEALKKFPETLYLQELGECFEFKRNEAIVEDNYDGLQIGDVTGFTYKPTVKNELLPDLVLVKVFDILNATNKLVTAKDYMNNVKYPMFFKEVCE